MKNDRKTELVACAIALIAERGYDSFSYQDLADRSGLAKPSIHHHFATKEALGLAAVETVERGLLDLMRNCLDQHGEEALMAFFANRTSGAKPGNACPLSSLQAEFNVLPTALQQRLREASVREVQGMADLLQAHVSRPGRRLTMPAPDAARMVMSAIKGSLLYGRTDGSVWVHGVVTALLQLLVVDDGAAETASTPAA